MSVRGNRREFLTDVGRGMLVATVGSATAADLGLARSRPGDEPERLTFGPLEPLVALMQETPPDQIVGAVVEQLEAGTELKRLVAAAALANARTFGGEDYVGFHTMMALAPAFHMARELPEARQALPVIKVLYRNTNRIQESGGRSQAKCSTRSTPSRLPPGQSGGEALRDAVRARTWTGAERTFAALAARRAGRGVQRPALRGPGQHRGPPHRPALPRLGPARPDRPGAGPHAAAAVGALLRQERARLDGTRRDRPAAVVLPKLLDQYKLAGQAARHARRPTTPGSTSMSQTIFEGTPEQAAEAAAAALAEGIAPDAVGEAISLAANQLVLRDAGRTAAGGPAGQAAGQRPRRLDRRPRLRLGQRLAEHGPRRATRGTRSPA